MPRCRHLLLTLPNAPEYHTITGPDLEFCFGEDGWLVLDFEGHDGGGIQIPPEMVQQIRRLLAAWDDDAPR